MLADTPSDVGKVKVLACPHSNGNKSLFFLNTCGSARCTLGLKTLCGARLRVVLPPFIRAAQ